MMKKIMMLMMLLFPVVCFSQETANYLILNDIGEFKYRPKQTIEMYGNSGVLIPTGHFYTDHSDITYETRYVHPVTIVGVEVQVTKHSGSDSDKWLLHEVEMTYQKARTLGASYAAPNLLKDINGNKIYFMWGHYKWISNYVVVSIDFTDLSGTKPEPLEIVHAYLQKFPSTIPSTLVFDNAHKIQWIKDEMDRRLWFCDKWFMQLQLRKVDEKQVYQESVKSMNIFLDYREKYYGFKAADEKNLIAGYLNSNNGTGIKAKLHEYKKWWVVNKEKAVNL